MAEIPVERKSSFPWWLLLLGLLAVAALWFFLAAGDEDNARIAETTRATQVAGAISLDDVRVTSLTGDESFMIMHNGQQHLVMFDEVRTPGTATEGRYDINPGDYVDIEGTFRNDIASLPRTVTRDIPAGTTQYIFATELSKD